MFFAGLIVGQQLLLEHIFEQLCRQHEAAFGIRRRAAHERFESVVGRAGIAVRDN